MRLSPVPTSLLVLAPLLPAQEVTDEFFETQVLPILEASCFECHGPSSDVKAGLRLTSPDRIFQGGESGPMIDFERPEASLFLRKLSYEEEHLRMPPEGKLPDAELEVLTKWVAAGAPWPEGLHIEVEEEHVEERLIKGDGREGWSYEPVQRPLVPAIEGPIDSPIDAFWLHGLQTAGLEPPPEADRRALLRRVTYDLIGLPPSPEEMEAFLADDSEDAWSNVVDRLLASPHYGERQGRYWLDLMRYAETNGYERDSDKPHIWRYRDYVIDAYNRNLPYDEFIIQQLAGDELEEPTPESLTATGYTRLMLWDDEPGNGQLQARYDVLDDLVRSTTEGFLGMTMGCARCHDHKGDPISAEEYYSFMAFFEDLEEIRAAGTLVDISSEEEKRERERRVEEYRTTLDQLTREQSELEDHYRRVALKGGVASGLTDLTYKFYRDTFSELPDFDNLRHENEGTLPGNLFDLTPATRKDNFGFVFEGRLTVPADGKYRFTIDSDDGSRFWIDGQEVVARDGTHGLGDPQTGEIELTAGSHPVRLDFFEWVGGEALVFHWEPAEPDLWHYTFEAPAEGWSAEEFDDSSWKEGPGGFGAHGTPASRIGTEWREEDIWLRREFEWSGDNADDLALLVHYDDDVQVYLNGVLAFSATGYVTRYGLYDVTPEARAAVRPGKNTIAVHCEQDFGGQYVHVKPIHRADAQGNDLRDLAIGRRALSASTNAHSADDLSKEIDQRGGEFLDDETFERWKKIRKERQDMQRRGEPKPTSVAFAATSRGPHPPQMHVHVRGSVLAKGKAVEPGVPECVDTGPIEIVPPTDGKSPGRRLALARWIADEKNPLTARVMVNRMWGQHFGRGLVPSTSDFGELGERPTHPELLDWLSAEFMESGWDVKAMHREMVHSRAYRSAYRVGDDLTAEVDPNNDLLWRFRMRRLSAEEVRDSILWLTGKLNPKMGGPSFYSMISREALSTSSRPDGVWGNSPESERLRRSVYIKVKRSMRTPMLEAFDLADTDNPCPERFTTTVPGQALALLNGEFSNLRAKDVAARLAGEHPGDVDAQFTRLIELALGRPAESGDLLELKSLYQELQADFGLSEESARVHCCLVVINLNEFVYVE